MASLQKRGRLYYVYFYDPTRTPARKGVPLNISLKSAAERRFRELEAAAACGDFDPWNPSPQEATLTLTEALERFLMERPHLRPASVESYRRRILPLSERLPAGLLVHQITPDDIRSYVSDAHVSEASRASRYRHVAALMRWAVEAGISPENPMKQVRPVREGRRIALFLTPEQVQHLVATIESDAASKCARGHAEKGDILWLRDVVLVAVSTGFRLGELCALRWGDVDLASGFIGVSNRSDFRSKSGDDRVVGLVGDAHVVIERLCAANPTAPHDSPVFQNRTGGRLYPNFVSRRFKAYVRKSGLPEGIHFHSLRHTCASWLVMRGVDLYTVQKILGHSSASVTERYAHLAPSTLKAAMQSALGT